MFHLLGYNRTTTATDVNADTTAATDPSFSTRNGHYIFTEQYGLLSAWSGGATVTEARFNVPSLNAIGFHNVFPLGGAVVPTSPIGLADYRAQPIMLPQNEEHSIQVTDTAIEQANTFLWIGPPQWSRNLATGIRRLRVRATQSPTAGLQSWGAFGALVFEATLKGGWYQVVGVDCVAAAASAFQLNFVRQPLIQGRKLFPGNLIRATSAAFSWNLDPSYFGPWGVFHTFEPPLISAWANAAGALSTTLFMDVIYLGESTPPPAVFQM
jgi:hypothetical protein